MQIVGTHACVFEGLPGDLQQVALLGIHGVGFARGYAEEACVELVDFAQKAALSGVGFSDGFGVGVVDGVRVPTLGEGLDGVAAGHQQVPVLLGGLHLSGEATGHAHNGHGLVGGDDLTGGDVGADAGDVGEGLLEEVAGDGRGGGIVEGHRGRNGDVGHAREAIAQFYRHEGVEAEVFEGLVFGDGGGARESEHRGDFAAHHLGEDPEALGLGQAREAIA